MRARRSRHLDDVLDVESQLRNCWVFAEPTYTAGDCRQHWADDGVYG
jgi:hypothetical protein